MIVCTSSTKCGCTARTEDVFGILLCVYCLNDYVDRAGADQKCVDMLLCYLSIFACFNPYGRIKM